MSLFQKRCGQQNSDRFGRDSSSFFRVLFIKYCCIADLDFRLDFSLLATSEFVDSRIVFTIAGAGIISILLVIISQYANEIARSKGISHCNTSSTSSKNSFLSPVFDKQSKNPFVLVLSKIRSQQSGNTSRYRRCKQLIPLDNIFAVLDIPVKDLEILVISQVS